MKTAEEILNEIFYKPESQSWYKPVLKAMREIADLAFDAGYKRNEHEQTIYADGFNYLLADKTTPTKEQFIKELFDTKQTAP